MAAVTQVIPNLLGGVSQQPDPVKLPGQVRDAINVYLDPTFGCRKRPGTKFIAKLANDVPVDAKWFSIFRDNSERYVVTCYNSGGSFVTRVWDAATGDEKTVTIDPEATAYFAGTSMSRLSTVTIGDYTLIANPNRVVSMSGGNPVPEEAAYVSIDQLGYNTTYAIHLDRDGSSGPVKQYRATGIRVSPGSYIVNDGGICSGQSAQSHTVSSGGKTGLTFRLTNQCAAFLDSQPVTIPTEVYIYSKATSQSERHTETFNNSDGYITVEFIPGSYTDSDSGGVTWEWYGHVQGGSGIRSGARFTSSKGVAFEVTAHREETSNSYKSRYTSSVLLQNGGVGWRVGDTVSVSQGGTVFTITVTSEAYEYVYASDGSAVYTTPVDTTGGNISMGTATAQLAAAVNAISPYVADTIGNVIRIRRTDDRSFNVNVKGGSLGTAMTVVKGTTPNVAKLPDQCWEGATIKVRNTESAAADDYYVTFEADSPGIPGKGLWVETVKPGIVTHLNPVTMPFALIRQADGDFTLGPLTESSALNGWAGREVGDEVSNPDPSFVGSGINHLLFYNNRLGFLSGESLILSQPGDYFNFFVTSALTVSDADPIDVIVASNKPSKLRSSVVTPRGLVLFSDSAQFLISTQDSKFSAQTIEIKQMSAYPFTGNAAPRNCGVSLFFVVESDTYSKVLEMSVDSLGDRPAIADDTRIIPQYIPTGLTWLTTSSANDMVLLGNGSSEVYVFKFFNQGEERKIAGWAKWRMPGGVVLLEDDVDTIYTVYRSGSDSILTSLELLDSPSESGIDLRFSSFVPRLDNYLIGSTLTTSPLPGGEVKVYFPDGAYVPGLTPALIVLEGDDVGTFVQPEVQQDGGGYYIVVDETLVSVDYILGLGFSMEVKLPSFYTSVDSKADTVFPPVIENVYLSLFYSGRYVARLERLGYDPTETEFSVGFADKYRANSALAIEYATLNVPVFCRGDQALLSITADDPVPSAITSYTWQGHYNNRGIQYLQR